MTDTIALVPYKESDYASLSSLDLVDITQGKSSRLMQKIASSHADTLLYTVHQNTAVGGVLQAQLHEENTVKLNALFIDVSLHIKHVVKAILKGFIALCRQGGVTTITAEVDPSTADYMMHAGFIKASSKHPYRLSYTIQSS